MTEYLAPGIYVEETSFRSKSIEGVTTNTTGFIGPARYGPIDLPSDMVPNLMEFERVYGDRQQLLFADTKNHNYLWHAVRAFFEEGGTRLYIGRIFRPLLRPGTSVVSPYKRPPGKISEDPLTDATNSAGDYYDGHARLLLTKIGSIAVADSIMIRARFPGAAGNLRISFTAKLGQNILAVEDQGLNQNLKVASLRDNDTVWLDVLSSPVRRSSSGGSLCVAHYDDIERTWIFRQTAVTAPGDFRLNSTTAKNVLGAADKVRVVTLKMMITSVDGASMSVWDDISLNPNHKNASGLPDTLQEMFAQNPSGISKTRSPPAVILTGDNIDTGRDLLQALAGTAYNNFIASLADDNSTDAQRTLDKLLTGGNDGQRPTAVEYVGHVDPDTKNKSGLTTFEDLEDISIVATPGATSGYNDNKVDANATVNALISHATRMRYRIAVLDAGENLSLSEVRDQRSKIDSSYAALYYPWIRIRDPVTNTDINVPPSGHVAGIYTRNDNRLGVYKAPANEVVKLSIGLEKLINKAQQDVLNPDGINCFRLIDGRGLRLWGARTVSKDPEWKYVNIRRYLAYLEHSIEKGTQWTVFESNSENLWGTVRQTIENFLLNEWKRGALQGDKPDKAYFVKCDRSTMTQNDLDNGRLVCLVGVAPLKPAEFVIFRIGQRTSTNKINNP